MFAYIPASTHLLSMAYAGSYKPHMREVDLLPLFDGTAGTRKAKRIILDSKSACLAEAGELYHLREHLKDRFEDIKLEELGALLDDKGKATQSTSHAEEDDITVL